MLFNKNCYPKTFTSIIIIVNYVINGLQVWFEILKYVLRDFSIFNVALEICLWVELWLEVTEAKEDLLHKAGFKQQLVNRWINMTLKCLRCELDVCESSAAVCKHTSLGKYCMHCVCVCVALSTHLVCSPHTGWRTSVVFSWLQNPCWRLPGYATSLSLCAAALHATPQRYSVKQEKMCIQLGQVSLTVDAVCHRNILEWFQQWLLVIILTKKLGLQDFLVLL